MQLLKEHFWNKRLKMHTSGVKEFLFFGTTLKQFLCFFLGFKIKDINKREKWTSLTQFVYLKIKPSTYALHTSCQYVFKKSIYNEFIKKHHQAHTNHEMILKEQEIKRNVS